MKHILLIFLAALLLPMPSFAVTQTTVLEVDGFGLTLDEAVQNGLIEAVKQAKGVSIDSRKAFVKSIQEKNVLKDGKHTHLTKIGAQNQSMVNEATKGLIHGYQIIDSSINGEHDWQVTLEVTLLQYKTPGLSPHGRRKIAILPFSTISSSYDFGQAHIPALEISRQFAQNLVTQITQTRKFTVLDREYIEEFLREKSIVLSSDVSVSQQMLIGEVLGVDYLLVGTISKASYEQTPFRIQASGETGFDHKASFIADYRIMVMATRQIKWSDSVRLSIGNSEIQEMRADSGMGQIQEAILEKAAKVIIHGAMENIYPIRVVKIQPNGGIILNQGGVTVLKGEMLKVFSTGQKIVDPQTNESLGSEESWVATIEIDRVIPKMSYARVIKGELSALKRGFICRRINTSPDDSMKENIIGRQTDVKSTSTGGVILPFD